MEKERAQARRGRVSVCLLVLALLLPFFSSHDSQGLPCNSVHSSACCSRHNHTSPPRSAGQLKAQVRSSHSASGLLNAGRPWPDTPTRQAILVSLPFDTRVVLQGVHGLALFLGSSRHVLGLWRALSGVSAKTSGAVRCRSGAGRGGSESNVEQWMLCRVASVRGVRSAGVPSGWRVLDRIGLTRADFFSPFRHPGSTVREIGSRYATTRQMLSWFV